MLSSFFNLWVWVENQNPDYLTNIFFMWHNQISQIAIRLISIAGVEEEAHLLHLIESIWL